MSTLAQRIGVGIATLIAAQALCSAAVAAEGVEERESLAPQLLLIHGGGFLHADSTFEAATRTAAEAAGFVPHFPRYPLGDLPGAVREIRAAARRIEARQPRTSIYAYGSSAGGTLAALLASDGLVDAAVAKAPVSDFPTWTWPLGAYGSDYFDRIRATPGTLRRLSPLRRPARRPLLLVHGRRDAVVPIAMSEAFAAKFRRVHLWSLGGGHHLERARPRVLERSLAWLDRLESDSRMASELR